MTGEKTGFHSRKIKRSLSGRILQSTTLNLLLLVIICCMIMAFSMQSLANSILLDSLQPMARQSAKTVEANIHMLADRMMTIAGDSRISADDTAQAQADREAVLVEAAEIYELHTIALYNTDGQLVQGINDAPENLDSSFFAHVCTAAIATGIIGTHTSSTTAEGTLIKHK